MEDSVSSDLDYQEDAIKPKKIPGHIRATKSIDKFTRHYIKELPYYIYNLINKLNITNDDVYNCYICYKSMCGIFKKVITHKTFINHFQLAKCPYIELLFSFMDINKSGKIEWPEFLLTVIYLCMMKEKDMIELLFLLFDYDFDMILNDDQYNYICLLFNEYHIQLPTNYELKKRYCCSSNGLICSESLQLSYFSFSVYCQEDSRISDGLTNVVKILRNETLSEDKWWDMINQNDIKKKPINFHKYLFKHFNTISCGTDEATIQTSLEILFECCNPPTYHDYDSQNDFYYRYLYREKCLTGNEMKIGEQQHSLLVPIGKLVQTNDDDDKEGIALVIPDNYSHR